jgi:hypothetical protein
MKIEGEGGMLGVRYHSAMGLMWDGKLAPPCPSAGEVV